MGQIKTMETRIDQSSESFIVELVTAHVAQVNFATLFPRNHLLAREFLDLLMKLGLFLMEHNYELFRVDNNEDIL